MDAWLACVLVNRALKLHMKEAFGCQEREAGLHVLHVQSPPLLPLHDLINLSSGPRSTDTPQPPLCTWILAPVRPRVLLVIRWSYTTRNPTALVSYRRSSRVQARIHAPSPIKTKKRLVYTMLSFSLDRPKSTVSKGARISSLCLPSL